MKVSIIKLSQKVVNPAKNKNKQKVERETWSPEVRCRMKCVNVWKDESMKV